MSNKTRSFKWKKKRFLKCASAENAQAMLSAKRLSDFALQEAERVSAYLAQKAVYAQDARWLPKITLGMYITV